MHAGLEVLQPAIARQAEQRHLSLGECTQLLFLAAAAAACLAESSTALHVSPLCLLVCSCWVLVCFWVVTCGDHVPKNAFTGRPSMSSSNYTANMARMQSCNLLFTQSLVHA